MYSVEDEFEGRTSRLPLIKRHGKENKLPCISLYFLNPFQTITAGPESLLDYFQKTAPFGSKSGTLSLISLYQAQTRKRNFPSACIAHIIKPYRDRVFVSWISVRFYETGCMQVFHTWLVKCQNIFNEHSREPDNLLKTPW